MLVCILFAVPSPRLIKHVCLKELSSVVRKKITRRHYVALNKETTILTILQKLSKKVE